MKIALFMLPRQDSNLDYHDPESCVLPITPRGNYRRKILFKDTEKASDLQFILTVKLRSIRRVFLEKSLTLFQMFHDDCIARIPLVQLLP